MTEYETLLGAHAVIRAAYMTDQGSTHLLALQKEVWELVKAAKKRAAEPIVFSWPSPGYVLIGRGKAVRTYPDPQLDGLFDAWQIFLVGAAAGSVLNAADLVGPGRRPDNALRNRLAKAAEWVERETDCKDLAQAMRKPSISISADGRIDHLASRCSTIELY